MSPKRLNGILSSSTILAVLFSLILTLLFMFGIGFSGVGELRHTRGPSKHFQKLPGLLCQARDFQCPALVKLGFTYPFPREPGSYLFLDGVVYPYAEVTNDLLGDSLVYQPDGTKIAVQELLDAFGLRRKRFEPQTPVIGYGSNPSPDQLIRKFLVEDFSRVPVIPVMKGQIKDYDVVFSPHFVSYGSMPASIVPSSGTNTQIWVTWLDRAELKQMNNSEGAGGLYAFGTLTADVEVDGPDPGQFKVYVDCFGALQVNGEILSVRAVPATGRTSIPVTEVQALEAVLPTLQWKESLFDLLLSNVASQRARNRRTRQIEGLGVMIPDPNFVPEVPCSLPPSARAGGEF